MSPTEQSVDVLFRKKPRLSSTSDDDLDERRRLFLERNRSLTLCVFLCLSFLLSVSFYLSLSVCPLVTVEV